MCVCAPHGRAVKMYFVAPAQNGGIVLPMLMEWAKISVICCCYCPLPAAGHSSLQCTVYTLTGGRVLATLTTSVSKMAICSQKSCWCACVCCVCNLLVFVACTHSLISSSLTSAPPLLAPVSRCCAPPPSSPAVAATSSTPPPSKLL